MTELSVGFAADLVFAILVYSYILALAWAWRSSARANEAPPGFREKLRVFDTQTRPATTVTFFFAASVIIGAIVGRAL
jgi:hypothetical protein